MGADTTARNGRSDRRGRVRRVGAAALALGALAAIAVPGSAAAALPTTTNDLIVPAQSIGGLALGSTPGAISKAWGKSGACTEISCAYSGPVHEGEDPALAEVLLDRGSAGFAAWNIYISAGRIIGGATQKPNFNTPLTRFKTAKGIGLGSTAAELKHAYHGVKKQPGNTVYLLKGANESETVFTASAEGRISTIAIEAHPGG